MNTDNPFMLAEIQCKEQARSDLGNIYRHEGGKKSPGWVVILHRKSKRFYHMFNDKKLGGKDRALAAAKRWRNQIIEEHPRMSHQEIARSRPPGISGVSGVMLNHHIQKNKDGSEHIRSSWKAISPSWYGMQRTRLFNIERHGFEEAKRLAIEARKKFEREASDKGHDPLACKPPHPLPIKGIKRVGRAEGGTGWQVNINRKKQVFCKSFLDKKHGGTEKAFLKAKAWRDDILQKHPVTPPEERSANASKSRSKSGVLGVFLIHRQRKRKDGSVEHASFWMATTPTGMPEQKKLFSLKKYGEEEAKRLAIEARKAFEAEAEILQTKAVKSDKMTSSKKPKTAKNLLHNSLGSNIQPKPLTQDLNNAKPARTMRP